MRGKERASDRTSESESQSERDRASLRLISCIVSLTQHDILSISFNGFIFSVFSLRCLHPAQRKGDSSRGHSLHRKEDASYTPISSISGSKRETRIAVFSRCEEATTLKMVNWVDGIIVIPGVVSKRLRRCNGGVIWASASRCAAAKGCAAGRAAFFGLLRDQCAQDFQQVAYCYFRQIFRIVLSAGLCR